MEEVKYIPGDLVTNHHDTVLRIVDMVAGFLYTEYQDGSPGLYISRKDVVPIPLTSEILDKNGWKHDGKWLRLSTGKAYIYATEESAKLGNFLICVGEEKHFIAYITYVHQLQHLLFGLDLSMDLKV